MSYLSKMFDNLIINSVCCGSKNKKQKCPPSRKPADSLEAQSSEAVPIESQSEDTTGEVEKNVSFADDLQQTSLLYSVPFRNNGAYERQVQSGDELSDYFKRPVEIFAFQWDVNTDVTPTSIFPWSRYLTNPAVIAKLDTYKLIHGTLHIKILVNGTPFHFGKLFVGVYPSKWTNNTVGSSLPNSLNTASNYRDEFNAGTALYQTNRTMWSSRPHVLVNPGKSEPAIIHWPFFSCYDWIDVTDIDAFEDMGILEIWSINDLRHANGSTNPVRVSFLAWMDDVEVAGITPTVPAQSSKYSRLRRADGVPPKEREIYPMPIVDPAQVQPVDPPEPVPLPSQSSLVKKNGNGNGNGSRKGRSTSAKSSKNRTATRTPVKSEGEYSKDGLISAPASAVASAAGYLVDIPFIGKFAKATQIGASAIGGIASLFGFSRPTNLNDQNFVSQNYYSLAVVDGKDNVNKLSLESKQEITVDPGTVGLRSDDELAFLNIAKREALIHTFRWVVTTSAEGNALGHLWACRVNPMTAPISGGRQCMTPVGFIAYPFRYWTGALRFRIQVVCSQMHNGRLLIAYNPDCAWVPTSTPDLNTRFSHIMDISKETDCTFEINWAQPEAFREVQYTGNSSPNNDKVILGPISAMIGQDNDRCNGRLDIFIMNQLTAPNIADTSDVDINVWISAGDSFKVNNPKPIAYINWGTGSQFPLPEAESSNIVSLSNQEDEPYQSTHYVLNGDYDDGVTDLQQIYFGESVVSIRSMLKRYCAFAWLPKMTVAPPGSLQNTRLLLHTFPSGRCINNYGSSRVLPVAIANTNGGPMMTYLRYYCQAFIGFRGGIRYKFMSVLNNYGWNYYVTRFATRIDAQVVAATEIAAVAEPSGALVATRWDTFAQKQNSAAGIAVSPAPLGTGVLCEIPFQQPLRFAHIHETDATNIRGSGMYDAFGIGNLGINYSANDAQTGFEMYVAGAEDATFFFFVGAPPALVNTL